MAGRQDSDGRPLTGALLLAVLLIGAFAAAGALVHPAAVPLAETPANAVYFTAGRPTVLTPLCAPNGSPASNSSPHPCAMSPRPGREWVGRVRRWVGATVGGGGVGG